METEKRVHEVVKEYVLRPDELSFTVHGRICKDTTDDVVRDEFRWEISHYYGSSETAGVYIPSKITFHNLQEAEQELMLYMKGFTNIGVKPNEYY